MKSKMICLITASATMLFFPLYNPQANAFDSQSGYNRLYTQTYMYNATNPGGPQYNGRVQYGSPAPYTSGPVTPRQPIVAQQNVAPQGVYHTTLPSSPANRHIGPSSKRKVTRKPIKSARAAGANRVSRAYRANQWQQRPVARTYPPAYAAQPRPAVRQGYNQWPQAGYYTNPDQARTQYWGTPNYYQGYNSWGSSPQACTSGA